MTRIVVDAMGSDDHPTPDIEGSLSAAREYGVEIVLVGDEALINPVLTTRQTSGISIRVVHAPEMLTMEDKGEELALKARHKDANNSMAIGIDLVKKGEADAFVTAGNTGAAMLTALFRLGRMRGVDRPALAPSFPTATGSSVVIDIGANPDCKPENLLQFAIMGSVYAEKVRGVKLPKVGLVSNGEEEGKGNELVRSTTPLLKKSELNYYGNVEGKEVIGGVVDVAVTDGFTGNVLLKTSEGVSSFIFAYLQDFLKDSSTKELQRILGSFQKHFSYEEYPGALVCGVDGIVIKCHGAASKKAMVNSIWEAVILVENRFLEKIKAEIL